MIENMEKTYRLLRIHVPGPAWSLSTLYDISMEQESRFLSFEPGRQHHATVPWLLCCFHNGYHLLRVPTAQHSGCRSGCPFVTTNTSLAVCRCRFPHVSDALY